jgi:hypothetical protein
VVTIDAQPEACDSRALTAHNPYASPGAPSSLPAAPAPLPPGARRLRIDPARFRAFVARWMFRFFAITGGSFVFAEEVFVRFEAPHEPFWPWRDLLLGLIFVGIALVMGVFLQAFRRGGRTYELLVGERAIRRTLAGVPPAEVLRSEISGAFETSDGLWLTCTTPRRSLFVWRAVEGYDEVRAVIAAWQPIEAVRGWTAWRRSRVELLHQEPRDVVGGTLLARDPSLALELEALRHASEWSWAAYPQVSFRQRRRRVRVALLAWAGLVLLLLMMWQCMSVMAR